MMIHHNVIVTCIHGIFLFPKNPPGKIGYYMRLGGLPTNEMIFRLEGKVESSFDNIRLLHEKNCIEILVKGGGKDNYSTKTIEPGQCIDVFLIQTTPLLTVQSALIPEKFQN